MFAATVQQHPSAQLVALCDPSETVRERSAAALGVPVYADPVEVAHARRERIEQAGPADIAKVAWRPGVLPWAARVVRAGALRNDPIPHAAPDGPRKAALPPVAGRPGLLGGS